MTIEPQNAKAGDKVTFISDIDSDYGVRRVKGLRSRIVKITVDLRNKPFIIIRDPLKMDFQIHLPLENAKEFVEIEYGGQGFFDRFDRFEG